MKTSIKRYDSDFIKLQLAHPDLLDKDRPVVAVFTAYEGTDIFQVEDVRLGQYMSPGPCFCASAEHYQATYTFSTEEELAFARSLIKETFSSRWAKGPLDLAWCTFEGIVRGRRPAELGLTAEYFADTPTYHTREEAMALLNEIQAYWEAQDISYADPDWLTKAKWVKIENPHRQLTQTSLSFELYKKSRPDLKI